MKYQNIKVKGLNIFYRESGSETKPVFLLLHGFPSSSHMYRDLMVMLEDKFHVIAPDLIGFGQSDAPSRASFKYTFENLTAYVEGFIEALNLDKFYMYVFDYGAPIGFRVAMRHPEKILGIVSQNGNVYEEGLGKKWEARAEYWNHPSAELCEQYKSAFSYEIVKGQYTYGTEPDSVAPDGYCLDIYYANTIEDYAEKQSDLIFDYQTNVALYPSFQNYLRKYQPKLLAIWGQNDPSFIFEGAKAFKKDLPDVKIVGVNSGHFALESCCREIADNILDFFAK
ncbi:MAG: alpha/beta fold hydrolase [Succinivibrio sp.]|nr:alpha/beta fold hydrolase [Succinivibrio sp.]